MSYKRSEMKEKIKNSKMMYSDRPKMHIVILGENVVVSPTLIGFIYYFIYCQTFQNNQCQIKAS